MHRAVLTLECPDVKGVVAEVATLLANRNLTITESNQFNDAIARRFFLRAAFTTVDGSALDLPALREAFAEIAARFSMDWSINSADVRPRVLIGVSRFGHCLYDLVHRWRSDLLPVDIVGVFSNHEDMRGFVEWNGLPFHHLPVSQAAKRQQELQILELVSGLDVDLIVLARYMQILSPDLCAALSGRCINIHHSFLPSFKGAKPYHQAHARGVKIIGATAHYVTTDLDEGPIIEQAVERVGHGHTPSDLVAIGRDIETVVLSRAVKWHAERRVMLSGQRTIIFG